jgi:hypothetical protein
MDTSRNRTFFQTNSNFPVAGFPLRELKMQALLPQPPEACKAYLDSYVQEAAQEGIHSCQDIRLYTCLVF